MLSVSYRPLGIIPTLLFIALFAVLLRLGFWQLDRAEQKRAMITAYEQQQQREPIELSRTKPLAYTRIKATGQYDNAHHFLWDNQFHQHRLGYHVLTPFIVKGSAIIILVDRGWIPRGESRKNRPAIKPVTDNQVITGTLYRPQPLLQLGSKIDSPNTWPRLLESLDIQAVEQQLGKKLYPFVVRLEKSAEHGFVRQWQLVNMPPAKHQAYALQWFTMAFVVAILFIACQLTRKE